MKKSNEIIKWLRDGIIAERYPPGGKIPSEYELARIFNVNKITANKAVAALVCEGLLLRGVQGSGTFVKKGLCLRGSIMLIISVSHTHYAQIANGAQREALSRGYLSHLAAPYPERLGEFLKGIDSSITRGIITSTYGLIEMPEGIPLIHVEREFPPSMSPSCLVNSDGSNGIALATKEMLGQGHRDIAYVGSDLLPSRATGFITAATAGGIGDAKRRVFVHRGDQASVFRLFLEIRQAFPKLTGIVTGSDDNALILLRYAKDKGIRIPDDLSLTGYGNIPQISETFALTSVEQHPTELGAIAAGRLIDMIEGKFKSDNFLELTPCELVRRHSVAKLPGESVQKIP